MRSLRIVVAGALLAFASCTPVYAQKATNINWAGLYVGLGAGYGWGEAAPDTPGTPTLTSNGFMGDALVGYNFQFGNFVLGPEFSIAFGDIKGEVKDGNYLTYDGRADMLATFAGRLGFAFDRFMPYVKGGAALAELTAKLSCPAGAGFGVCHSTGPFSSSVDASKWGWAIGGGIEYVLDPNWSIGAEYMYYDFGSVSVTYQTPLGPAVGESKVTFNTALATLKYRF